MGFTFNSLEFLKTKLELTKETLTKRPGGTFSPAGLPKEREEQIAFLEAVLNDLTETNKSLALKTSEAEHKFKEKKRQLDAAVAHVKTIVSATGKATKDLDQTSKADGQYKTAETAYLTALDNQKKLLLVAYGLMEVIFNEAGKGGLCDGLNIAMFHTEIEGSKKGELDAREWVAVFTAAEEYMNSHVFTKGDIKQGYQEDHFFVNKNGMDRLESRQKSLLKLKSIYQKQCIDQIIEAGDKKGVAFNNKVISGLTSPLEWSELKTLCEIKLKASLNATHTGTPSIEKLPPERQKDIKTMSLMQKFLEEDKHLSDAEKAVILYGFLCLLRGKILRTEYNIKEDNLTEDQTDGLLSGSEHYKNLTKHLKPSKVPCHDLVGFIEAARGYLMSKTVLIHTSDTLAYQALWNKENEFSTIWKDQLPEIIKVSYDIQELFENKAIAENVAGFKQIIKKREIAEEAKNPTVKPSKYTILPNFFSHDNAKKVTAESGVELVDELNSITSNQQ